MVRCESQVAPFVSKGSSSLEKDHAAQSVSSFFEELETKSNVAYPGPMPFEFPSLEELDRLPLKIAIAIALGAYISAGFHWLGWINVSAIHPGAPAVLAIVVVFASVFLAIAAFENAFVAWKQKNVDELSEVKEAIQGRSTNEPLGLFPEESERRRAYEYPRAVIALGSLSEEENHIVAECLRRNTNSFRARASNSEVSMLMSKGLVGTPGGSHDRNSYPFFFHAFVWDNLMQRKDEILRRDERWTARR